MNTLTASIDVQTEVIETKNLKLAIYVPSESNGKNLSKELIKEVEKECLIFLCDICGGCTIYPGTGIWVNNNREIVRENVLVIQSYGEIQTFEIFPKMKEFCLKMKEILEQDAIAFEIDNKLHII